MKLFVMVLWALISLTFAAQAQEGVDTKAYCLSNFPKDNAAGIDAEAYCSCVEKELSGKLNQPKEDDAKGRKKALDKLKPCLDKHAKAPMTRMCDTYNEQVKAMAKDGEKHPKLNCGCFYRQLVKNFTATWVDQAGEGALSQEGQEQVAHQTIAACLK